MAPRETPKVTKVQRTIVKDVPTKLRASPIGAIKKTPITKKTVEKTPLKLTNTTIKTRQRTSTLPAVGTPKPKENKSAPPGSVVKSAKKSTWKRRPKPAHSGVPIPEKMRKLMEKQLKDSEFAI